MVGLCFGFVYYIFAFGLFGFFLCLCCINFFFGYGTGVSPAVGWTDLFLSFLFPHYPLPPFLSSQQSDDRVKRLRYDYNLYCLHSSLSFTHLFSISLIPSLSTLSFLNIQLLLCYHYPLLCFSFKSLLTYGKRNVRSLFFNHFTLQKPLWGVLVCFALPCIFSLSMSLSSFVYSHCLRLRLSRIGKTTPRYDDFP